MLGRTAISIRADCAELVAGLRRQADELRIFRQREERRKAACKRPAWVLSLFAAHGLPKPKDDEA